MYSHTTWRYPYCSLHLPAFPFLLYLLRATYFSRLKSNVTSPVKHSYSTLCGKSPPCPAQKDIDPWHYWRHLCKFLSPQYSNWHKQWMNEYVNESVINEQTWKLPLASMSHISHWNYSCPNFPHLRFKPWNCPINVYIFPLTRPPYFLWDLMICFKTSLNSVTD